MSEPDPDDVRRLRTELAEALADEADASSRAASAMAELDDLGVTYDDLDGGRA